MEKSVILKYIEYMIENANACVRKIKFEDAHGVHIAYFKLFLIILKIIITLMSL